MNGQEGQTEGVGYHQFLILQNLARHQVLKGILVLYYHDHLIQMLLFSRLNEGGYQDTKIALRSGILPLFKGI